MEENNELPSIEKTTNLNKSFEEKLKDFSTNLFNISPLLVGIGIAMWWCLEGMVQITGANLSLTDRIAMTCLTIFIAMVYCNLISTGGFQAAKKAESINFALKTGTWLLEKATHTKLKLSSMRKTLQELIKKNYESRILKMLV